MFVPRIILQFSRTISYSFRSGRKVKEKLARMAEVKSALAAVGATEKVTLKCAKGTRDFDPTSMAIRERVLRKIVECFKRHGAETIDTPVFERKEVLLGKYGEEGGKLIFDLADQGGEALSLRYDLTVPFARYLAMNKITNIKRYSIAKVYRRDQPVMTKGRFREFYQCDFDIAGQYDSMIPESECLRIIDEVLQTLELGSFRIKLNHRLLLEGMFTASGINLSSFKTVCSSIDKLDKVPWAEVRDELIREKRIDIEAVDNLEKFVRAREVKSDISNMELLENILQNEGIKDNKSTQRAVNEMKLLLKYCEYFGVDGRIVVDPSLARGLDYYTGVIYEAVIEGFHGPQQLALQGNGEVYTEESTAVGSVAAGGRYDDLVGMFSPKNKTVPCVGVSFGVERLFSIIAMKIQAEGCLVRTVDTEVFVASAQKNLLPHRMQLCRLLWDNDIKAEISYKSNPRMLNQLQYCEERSIPLAIIIGESELENGVLKVRNVKTREEKEIPRKDIIDELRNRLHRIDL